MVKLFKLNNLKQNNIIDKEISTKVQDLEMIYSNIKKKHKLKFNILDKDNLFLNGSNLMEIKYLVLEQMYYYIFNFI